MKKFLLSFGIIFVVGFLINYILADKNNFEFIKEVIKTTVNSFVLAGILYFLLVHNKEKD